MKEMQRILVEEINQTGEARRLVAAFCRLLGFSDEDIGRVSLIATEAATNLVKHASGGELLVQDLECGGVTGVEILSIDRGPGMANLSRCMEDGVSTAGSPGTGLGAIRRTSSLFDIFSEPGKGTVMMSRYWTADLPKGLPERPLEVGAVSLPITEEESCGDGWAADQGGRRSMFLLCDGLGHGISAAEASREAVRIFKENRSKYITEIVEALHAGIRGTRGAALAVLEADHRNGIVRYCGIGNIAARIVSDGTERTLVSHNGIAGQTAHKIQEFTYPWDAADLLVMHSDGIGSKWRLSDYPRLELRHPSVIAAVLYRDFRRERDDCTVLVAKKRNHHGPSNT